MTVVICEDVSVCGEVFIKVTVLNEIGLLILLVPELELLPIELIVLVTGLVFKFVVLA